MKYFLLAAVLLICACQPKLKLVEVQPEDQHPPVEEAKIPPKPDLLPGELPPGVQPSPMPIEPVYRKADWRTLRGLNVKTGEVSAELRKLEGGVIQMEGYMVPFEDEYETATEFLLVPQAGMCVHLPPPPMNQIILVQMTNGAANVTWSKPVTVSGVLEISKSESPYGNVSFKMNASAAQEDPRSAY